MKYQVLIDFEKKPYKWVPIEPVLEADSKVSDALHKVEDVQKDANHDDSNVCVDDPDDRADVAYE